MASFFLHIFNHFHSFCIYSYLHVYGGFRVSKRAHQSAYAPHVLRDEGFGVERDGNSHSESIIETNNIGPELAGGWMIFGFP
jgi:hypothetical protein